MSAHDTASLYEKRSDCCTLCSYRRRLLTLAHPAPGPVTRILCSPAIMDRPTSTRQYVPRPHAQPEILDPRYASIPPPPHPPFTARPASAQPTVVHSGDPFLQRRVNTEEQQHTVAPSRTYGQSLRANYVTESFAAQHERARREDYSSLLRDRHERPGQYMTRPPDSMSHLLHLPALYIAFIPFWLLCSPDPIRTKANIRSHRTSFLHAKRSLHLCRIPLQSTRCEVPSAPVLHSPYATVCSRAPCPWWYAPAI